MKRVLVLAFALAIAVAASHDAWAQRGRGGRGFGGGGGFGLLAQKSVQDELKLSDDQVKQVAEQLEKQRESFAGAQDLSREERQKRFAERQKANQETLGKILNGEQLKRFKQIDLQQRGAVALGDDEVATALNLTAEQKQQVSKIQESLRGEMREAFQGGGGNREEARKKIETLQTSTNDKLKALLSAEQQTKWKELTGEPFKGEIRRPQPRGGNRPAGAGRRQTPNRASQAEISRPTFRLASFRANEEDEVARADRGPNAEVWSRVAKAAGQRSHWRGHEGRGHDRDGNRFYAHHHGRGAARRGHGYHGQRFVEHGRSHHGHGQQFARHHHGGYRPGHHFAGQHGGYRGYGSQFARHHGYHGHYRYGHEGRGQYGFAWHDRGGHQGHARHDAWHHGRHGHGPAHFAAGRGPQGHVGQGRGPQGHGYHGHSHHFASWRSHHPHHGDHFDRPRDDRPGRPPMPPSPPDHRRGELGPRDQSLAGGASDLGNSQAEATQLAQFKRNLSSLAEQIEALRRELRR